MVNEKYIFLSYSSINKDFVIRLRYDLIKKGLNVWLDQIDILIGDRWDDTIQAALKNSQLLILIISPESVESEVVRNEEYYAKRVLHIPVIYVLYKPVKEFPFLWQRHQFIELHENNYDTNFSRLVDAIQKQLQRNKIPLQEEHIEEECKVEELNKQDVQQEKTSFFLKYSVFGMLILLGGGAFYLYHLFGGFKQKSVVKETPLPQIETNNSIASKNDENDTSLAKHPVTIKREENVTQPVVVSRAFSELKEPNIEDTPKEKTIQKRVHPKQQPSAPVEKQHVSKPKVNLKKAHEEVVIEKEIVQKSVINAPYDQDHIVEEFVELLGKGEDIIILVKVHSKANEDIDHAYDRVYNLEEWLIKRGIAQDHVESEVIDDQKGGISYEIVPKGD